MIRVISLLLLLFALVIPAVAESTEAELVLQHGSGVVTASWNADETQILSATEAGMVQVWSVEDGEVLLSIDHSGNPVTHAQWMRDGKAILSADESGIVNLSATADGAALQSWQLDGMPITLEVNDAETRVLAFTDGGQGRVLSLSDGATVAEFENPTEISGAGWSADETQVRSWTEAGLINVWDVESGDEISFSLPHRGMLLGLEWNADDTLVLAWFTNGAVNVYETDGVSVGRRSISGVRHRSFVQRAIWSQDESMVMSWAGDDTVHIWSVDGSRSQRVFQHEDWVIGARWDQDESRVLSWSHIYVYLWDDDEMPQRFRHRNLIRGAIWNSDATRILSWSWDGTARVWSA